MPDSNELTNFDTPFQLNTGNWCWAANASAIFHYYAKRLKIEGWATAPNDTDIHNVTNGVAIAAEMTYKNKGTYDTAAYGKLSDATDKLGIKTTYKLIGERADKHNNYDDFMADVANMRNTFNKKKGTIEKEIIRRIDNGDPVSYKSERLAIDDTDPHAHYLTIIGYKTQDDGQVIFTIYDPNTEDSDRLTHRTFEKLYSAYREDADDTAISYIFYYSPDAEKMQDASKRAKTTNNYKKLTAQPAVA